MSDDQLSVFVSDSLTLSCKGSCSPSLPSELLYQIFTHCDPATVLLSLRCLSSSWRHKVDRALLPHLFSTRAWRIGLQISRRPRHGHSWGGSILGTAGTTTPNGNAAGGLSIEEEDEEMLRQRWQDERERISRRSGALEDELPGFPLPHATSGKPAPVTHVIPLEFGRISHTPLTQQSNEPTLRFATRNSNWYALFESNDDENTLPADPEQARIERRRQREEARLALDFGLIWRFPGDGQGDAEWGTPDPEMGWLSRFYCSQGDLVKAPDEFAMSSLNVKGKQTVRSTPLARRVRSRLGANFDDGTHTPPSMDWSDAGQEYLNLNLALSASFFARRSARSNKLMRLLEEAAERSDAEPSASGNTLRAPWTPLERGKKKKKGKPTVSPAPSCASPSPFRPGSQSGALWMASGASLSSNKQISRLTAGQSGVASGANTPFRSGTMTPISRPATPSTSSRTRALATPAPVAPRATFQATLLSAEALAPLRRVQQAQEDETGASSSTSATSAYVPSPAAGPTAPSAWDAEPRNEWGIGTSRSAELDAQAGGKAQVWTWTR